MPVLLYFPFFFIMSGLSVSVEPANPYQLSDNIRDTFYIDTGNGLCYVALPPTISKPATNCGADESAFDIHTNCEFKSFKISIVNESDVLVFESDNPDIKWSGCNGYHAFPQGGYYYTIRYKVATSEGTKKGKLQKGFSLSWYYWPKKY